jgi:chromosome partitioning protein
MNAKTISIINMKGGVGKTTLSINLGRYLSERKHKKVLLIDLDPQANATIVGIDPDFLKQHLKQKKTVADLFINCLKSYGPFPKTEEIKIEVSEYLHRSFESTDKKSYLDIIPSEIILSSVLKGVSIGPYELNRLLLDEVKKKYDFIIVDCAPTYSLLTTLALNATEALLMPVMADSFGVYGVQLMKHVIEEHQYDYGVEIKVVGLVFTMWEKDKKHQENFMAKIRKEWELQTFNAKISRSDWYRIANGKREMIWESKAHQAIKDEFDAFVEEFLQKV